MISTSGSEPADEVPEADWAEQQVTAEPDPGEISSAGVSRSSSTEADTADLADQDREVVLDDEQG